MVKIVAILALWFLQIVCVIYALSWGLGVEVVSWKWVLTFGIGLPFLLKIVGALILEE